MSTSVSFGLRRLAAASLLTMVLGLAAVPVAWADSPAAVFPLKAFNYDESERSALDKRFLAEVAARGPGQLAETLHKDMHAAFQNRVGVLNRLTMGRTFVASFQVARAVAYHVEKGNGNRDVVASVTGSLYFTNVQTGEILKALSDSVVSRAVISAEQSLDAEVQQQFGRSLLAVMGGLVKRAAVEFNPAVVDAKVMDRIGNLLVLDAGHRRGIQLGDQLSDASGELIEVVYAAADYAVAQPVLADKAGPGAVFQKYLAHASDGKIKPRTVVFVESFPDRYAKEYVAQLFSELVGDKAPMSVVLVSPGFNRLLERVQQAEGVVLDSLDLARRHTPELIVRLRVAEPIMYEAPTNLDFKQLRHYETLAFADVLDTQGRVLFSAMGKDTIDDTISNGIGPGQLERREISIKNALQALAERFATLTEPKAERVQIGAASDDTPVIDSTGRFYAPRQRGVVLRQANVQGPKGLQSIWLPTTEAELVPGTQANRLALNALLPLDQAAPAIAKEQQFELQRLGTPPRSDKPFSICPDTENLGSRRTPSLLPLATLALSNRMPGMLYAPELPAAVDQFISPRHNFKSTIGWKLPATQMTCVQAVDRVNAGEPKCDKTCDVPMTSAYSMRVRVGADVVSRKGFELQYRSSSYYRSIPQSDADRMLEADIVDEAGGLLDKIAAAVQLP